MSCQIGHATDGVTLDFDIGTQHLAYERFQPAKLDDEQFVVSCKSINKVLVKIAVSLLFTAKFPRAALAALCTSASWLLNKKRIGSSVSLPTGRTSFSVISAKARAALRWRSTLSEKESVVSADRGSPEKKLVVARSVRKVLRKKREVKEERYTLSRYCRRSATASRSFSKSSGSYCWDLRPWTAKMWVLGQDSEEVNVQHDSQQLDIFPIRYVLSRASRGLKETTATRGVS